MRLHSNKLRASHVRDALQAEKDAGRIARHVTFKTLKEHGSRSHEFAVEVQLEASVRDNGRRVGNSGSYGSMSEGDLYAATYDEWGWLIAALYEIDPYAVWGTVKYPQYADAVDFHHITGMTYDPENLIWYLENGYGDPYPIVTGQGAKAKRGYLIGRRGANRADSSYRLTWGARKLPRTVEEIREYANLNKD